MKIINVGKAEKIFNYFPEHQHGYWEILLNLQGSGLLTVGEEKYLFSPGTIAVIPPYTPHGKTSKEGFLDQSVFIEDFRQIGNGGVKIFQDNEEKSVEQIFSMALYFYELNKVSESKRENAVINVLGDLLYHVLASYYTQQKKRDIRLEGILELMHQNVGNEDFDLTKYMQNSGYSTGYFRRIFKEMTGQSPVQYFHWLRINRGKSLLKQYGTSRSIKDIAAQCGFSDPLYFSRIFKKIEGKSPQQYIRSQFRETTEEEQQRIDMDSSK